MRSTERIRGVRGHAQSMNTVKLRRVCVNAEAAVLQSAWIAIRWAVIACYGHIMAAWAAEGWGQSNGERWAYPGRQSHDSFCAISSARCAVPA
jgi:hypothetical protein